MNRGNDARQEQILLPPEAQKQSDNIIQGGMAAAQAPAEQDQPAAGSLDCTVLVK